MLPCGLLLCVNPLTDWLQAGVGNREQGGCWHVSKVPVILACKMSPNKEQE